MTHSNLHLGWILIGLGLASGMILGLGFYREDFLGGYSALRRRLCRLGHIAFVALGILNVLFAVAMPETSAWPTQAASLAWKVGGVSMPATCFLTAWLPECRWVFFFPVVVLLAATVLTLIGGAR